MASNLPSVRYHTTVYVEESQRMFENSVGVYAIENAIKVINGSLESVLHLIGYSFHQIRRINRELAIKYQTNQNVEIELSYSEKEISEQIKSQRPTRAHIVEHENRLYGVIVDDGRARICGQINRIIPKMISSGPISDQNSIVNRGLKISRSYSEGQPLKCEDEFRKHLESGQNFVVVSEKGAVFLVPNDNPSGHQFENKLTLILGHGFIIINEPIVQWIRSKQHLSEERRESTQLLKNESIIASFAAICVSSNDLKIYGTGSVINIKNIKEFYRCL